MMIAMQAMVLGITPLMRYQWCISEQGESTFSSFSAS